MLKYMCMYIALSKRLQMFQIYFLLTNYYGCGEATCYETIANATGGRITSGGTGIISGVMNGMFVEHRKTQFN